MQSIDWTAPRGELCIQHVRCKPKETFLGKGDELSHHILADFSNFSLHRFQFFHPEATYHAKNKENSPQGFVLTQGEIKLNTQTIRVGQPFLIPAYTKEYTLISQTTFAELFSFQ